MGRRGLLLVPAGPGPRWPARARHRARPSRRSASSASSRTSRRAAPLGRLRAHRAQRRERRRGHPHELPQGGRRLGPQRAQVLHHERRARLVERGLRDHRSEPRTCRAPRLRRREGHARASRSGRIEEKMGLRASETAELVLEDCRVPEENLLGGEEAYVSKEGFMTAMKTFDNTRPIVAAMALGIGRAAYEYARDFVKENYVLAAPRPALRGHRRAPRARGAQARGRAPRDLARGAGWPTTASPTRRRRACRRPSAGQAAIARLHRGHRDLRRRGHHRRRTTSSSRSGSATSRSTTSSRAPGSIQRIVISKRLITDLKSF